MDNFLNDGEIEQLKATRQLLWDLQKRARHRGNADLSNHDMWSITKVECSCEHAADAVFDVLNTVNSHLDQEMPVGVFDLERR